MEGTVRGIKDKRDLYKHERAKKERERDREEEKCKEMKDRK